MDVQAFTERLFAAGGEAGFDEMEVYYQVNRETMVRVFKGEIDVFSQYEKGGLSFRGLTGGKMGYSFTEKLDEDSIGLLIEEAKGNAEIVESESQETLFEGSERYVELPYPEKLRDVSAADVIAAGLELERVALAYDPRVQVVNYCVVGKAESDVTIRNTKGLNCRHVGAMGYGMLSAVAKEGGDLASASEYAFALEGWSELDVRDVAEKAAQQALSKLSAKPVPSDEYAVILRHDVAADLLKQFSSMFSGEAADKGLSLLQGKLGEQVMGANITILDDPHRPDGPGSVSFDSEGVATAPHEIVQGGRLLTFLHNRKSAAKAGVASTGNAAKGTYRSPVAIQPTNLCLQPGDQSLDDLIAGTERGILLVELQGLHSGANTISGDFSLATLGYLIEGGKIVRAVNQITVSGNFLSLMNDVEAIGNDVRFRGSGRGATGCPSLKVRKLSIAGL